MNFRRVIVYSLLVLLVGCIDQYSLPIIVNDFQLLVVDGFMNSKGGSAQVRLSRSNSPSTADKPNPEDNAAVNIVSESGVAYHLAQSDSGMYTASGLTLDVNARHQLRVRTIDGEEFESDFVSINATPPIDSVNWVPVDDGVKIFVNTHDPSGKTRYFVWQYIETWQYHAAFLSQYKLVGKTPIFRSEEEQIDPCWRTIASTKFFLASSADFSQDAIRNYPIIFLEKGSSRLSVKYSILIKQRALSQQEFTYLDLLRKTTESQGGLFDPLPVRVIGNLRNLSDPKEPVLGFFSGGSIDEQRIFIDYNNLPKPLQVLPLFPGCAYDTVCLVRPMVNQYNGGCQKDLQNLAVTDMILTDILDTLGVRVGFTKTIPECADCRYQGGSLKKPSFWKD
jgi:Domain of unknown function (DUF4249)